MADLHNGHIPNPKGISPAFFFFFLAYANNRELHLRNCQSLAAVQKGNCLTRVKPSAAQPHTAHCCSDTVARYVYTTLERTDVHVNALVRPRSEFALQTPR